MEESDAAAAEEQKNEHMTEISSPNIVDWDGPDDPQNPMNWSPRMKIANVGMISYIAFVTPLASSMFAPAIPQVDTSFHNPNAELSSFVVSVYVLGFAIGPLLIAPVSEMLGRVKVYHTCNVLFLIFTVCCAVSVNMSKLIIFRFLAGCAGAAALTIGGGTIADIVPQQRRGMVMSVWALGPLTGPVVGPVAGGFLAEAKGWRWVFWILTIVSGTIVAGSFLVLRETYAPVLLQRKTERLQKETGNLSLRSKLDQNITPKERFRRSIIRPLKLLFCSPIVLAMSAFAAVSYGYLYLMFTTLTTVYETQYHFGTGIVGLTYLGIGIGTLLAVIIFGLTSDAILKRMSVKGEMKPEYRLPPMIPGAIAIPVGLFWYGWTAEKQVFWLVPILGTMIVGFGIMACFMPIQTYLVDAYTIHAASAMAANTVLRSIVGACLPLAGRKMYATLGLGWGNSLLGFIAVGLIPIPLVFLKYGERLRTNPRFQIL